MSIVRRRIQRDECESERGNMKGCDYVSKSLSSPLLLPYLSVTKRQTIFEICRTLLEDRGNLRRRARLSNKETKVHVATEFEIIRFLI